MPPNRTGLPDELKAGVEALSGLSMDGVKVHFNSPRPAHFQAYAYTQGSHIHVGPGQEHHLAHEAWHVVQQKQGRVRPTTQMKGAAINEDDQLEREADAMGDRARAGAAAGETGSGVFQLRENAIPTVVQLARTEIPKLGKGDITTAKLRAQLVLIDQEIASVEPDEVEAGTVVMNDLVRWRAAYDIELQALEDRVVDQNTGMSVDDIMAKKGDLGERFYRVGANRANLVTALNSSLNAREGRLATQSAKSTSAKKDTNSKQKSETTSTSSASKYKPASYSHETGGAIVLVEGKFVVSLEHYQLKHNADIKILYAGGPYKGAKGSQLEGGWDAHVKIYGPAVLEHAKKLIADQKANLKAPPKARLGNIECYLSITQDGDAYIISYHGNPPD